jgi:hypothetical protein
MCIWLLAILYKSVSETSRLDLFEHSVGICLYGIRTDLHTVIFLRRVRFSGRFRCRQPSLNISTESVHVLAKLREPVSWTCLRARKESIKTMLDLFP